jgi:glycerophosphoryl diester phosphodiesterase
LVVAHRGLLRHAPENTLANFRACLELRVGFEIDVARSKDGRLVCIHDATVDRTTDGKGKVADLTLEQLQQLDAGSWFGAAFRGQRIPTIDEVFALLAAYRQAAVLIAVDLKADDARLEHDVVRLAEKHKVLDRLLFIGRTIGSPEVRQRLRTANAKAHVAKLANNRDEFPAALTAAGADWVYVRFLPSRREVDRVHQAGKRVFIAGATVAGREPDNWQKTANAGVDAVLTDYPLPLRQQLRE